MKFSTVLVALASTAAAAPAATTTSDDLIAITNQYSFQLSLPDFIERRDEQDPDTLDWSSDACSDSPDNPLGFPFEPGCYRHDFGYRNFKAQNRFKQNKSKIDSRLLSEYVAPVLLNYPLRCSRIAPSTYYKAPNILICHVFCSLTNQCQQVNSKLHSVCRGLAKVYYETVKVLGGVLSKRDALQDAVAAYEKEFRDAQAQGYIPADMNP